MLQEWIIEALRKLKGKSQIVPLARQIWIDHEDEIREGGDLLWTWQYRMRWSGTELVRKGHIRKEKHGAHSVWVLLKK